MIEHKTTTGDKGELRILDRTDDPSLMTVELWVRSLSPIAVPNLPWTHSLDGNIFNWRSYNLPATTLWQRLTTLHVSSSVQTVVLHLGNTNTSQLGGPTDLSADLAGYVAPPPPGPVVPAPKTVSIRVGNQYKKAVPYVREGGVWKQAIPMVRTDRGWREVE